MPAPVTHVLFDLDGTLIDTEYAAALALSRCFERWGTVIEMSDANYITGRKWDAAFEFLFRKYPLPAKLKPQDAMLEVFREYRASVETELRVVPGSVECVKALADEFPLALVSGSNREDILWALGKLGVLSLFQVILGAEDYAKSKPAPDGYLKALGIFGASPKSALVFEDSDAGIASARAAGIRVVAVSSTNHFGQKPSSADEVVEDLRPIDVDWVKRFSLR